MIPALLLGSGMLAAAAFDVAVRRVPNWLNVSILVAGLAVRGAIGGPEAVGWGAIGVLVGLAIGLVPFALRIVGGGDVKLVAAAGAWLGPVGVVQMIVVGAAGGGVLALIILATGGKELRREVGTNLVGAVYARRVPAAPERGKRQIVPLAVALGAAAVGVFLYMGGLRA
jgi:prepilin peptidase CpaA